VALRYRPHQTEAEAVARSLNTSDLVIKAQIHAGGRGKGTFKNGFKGGVKLVKTPEEIKDLAGKKVGVSAPGSSTRRMPRPPPPA